MTSGEGAAAALETARDFVAAIAWGEHHRIWELLGPAGRATVLRVATNRGMDALLAARLREATATADERDQFLADLVNGLRTDLAGTDLDALEYRVEADSATPGRARVVMISPLPEPLDGGLPVGSLELARDAACWRVERLVPRPGP